MIENDSSLFKVDVDNYKGPLDVLLDLAKAQKVDLEKISITKLADQFHEFITKEKKLNLEIASEYLLMATWLAYLKSKLLLPGTPEEEFKVLEVAEKLKKRMRDGDDKSGNFEDALAAELGDVLWYLANCASELGISLSDVALQNLMKLESRKARGVLGGSGDER